MHKWGRRMTKPTKWPVRPANTQISQGIRPCSLIRVFAVHMKKHWLPTERKAKTLIRLGRCPGWSESSLGAQARLLVLSCCVSFCRAAAHLQAVWNSDPIKSQVETRFSSTVSKKSSKSWYRCHLRCVAMVMSCDDLSTLFHFLSSETFFLQYAKFQ